MWIETTTMGTEIMYKGGEKTGTKRQELMGAYHKTLYSQSSPIDILVKFESVNKLDNSPCDIIIAVLYHN